MLQAIEGIRARLQSLLQLAAGRWRTLLVALAFAAALVGVFRSDRIATSQGIDAVLWMLIAMLAGAAGVFVGCALPWLRRLQQTQQMQQRGEHDLATLRTQYGEQRAQLSALQAQLERDAQTHARESSAALALTQQLTQTQATLDQTRRNRNLFVAMMSHEVRTPLHGLMSTLSLLRDESLSTQGLRRLEIARTSARSLLKIANDILDLSRIDAGGFSFEPRVFSPRQLVAGVTEEFQAMAQAQKLGLFAQHEEAVPRALIGDRDRIHQIIGNLVSNALKFTAHGAITVRTRWEPPQIVFDVIDTGPGVPAGNREMIFDSFAQADSAHNRRYSGTGLGLTISRHLAEAMGGALTLHETSTRGSTFRLRLTLPPSDEPVPEDESQRILAHPTGHVLVVEDNEANQYVARVLLESLGCTVRIADSGQAALDAVAGESFALILMDCQLPGMDGCETSRRLRRCMATRVPIIAMTANALPEDRARCQQAGMDDFLGKPFAKAALSRILNQWLDTGAATSGSHRTAEDIAVLDMAVLEALWEGVGWRTGQLRRIYDAFIDNVRVAIRLLETDAPPRLQLQRSLHTVRGSAGMVGAKQLMRIAAAMEHDHETHGLKNAAGAAASLSDALQTFRRVMEERLTSHPDVQPRQ